MGILARPAGSALGRVDPAIAFLKPRLVRVRVAEPIEPAPFVKPQRFVAGVWFDSPVSVLQTVTMVLEVARLDVKPGRESEFESAFEKASALISRIDGYRGHELQRCIEHPNRYILLVRWNTIENHTIGFRQSSEYQQWKSLLHHFYDPFPAVEHYESVFAGGEHR